MARYVLTDEFQKIQEDTGTAINISGVEIEISEKAEARSGIILYPQKKVLFSGKTLYAARAAGEVGFGILGVIPVSGEGSTNITINDETASNSDIESIIGGIYDETISGGDSDTTQGGSSSDTTQGGSSVTIPSGETADDDDIQKIIDGMYDDDSTIGGGDSDTTQGGSSSDTTSGGDTPSTDGDNIALDEDIQKIIDGFYNN